MSDRTPARPSSHHTRRPRAPYAVTRTLTIDGAPVTLTPVEADVYCVLERQRNTTMPAREVGARAAVGTPQRLAEIVACLHEKLAAEGRDLVHAAGGGYRLEPPPHRRDA